VEGKEPTTMAGRMYLDDIVTESFTYEDGNLIVPDRPGLGVELDPEKIERYRIS
jgi:L-alanine-DL-glutamate epimerase-like enolase superfamily enzyme